MLEWIIPAALAQDGAAPAPSPFGSTFFMVAVMFGLLYFILLRPQAKAEQKHREMLGALKKGDKIITSGGLHGRVHTLGETTFVIEVADKVRITINRANIAGRVSDEESK